MKDKRSKLNLYSAALKRLFMWHFMAKRLDLVLITEFPKSGASWFGQMFSDASNIPFPRNATPALKQNIMHGHYLFKPKMHKAIHVLRDGRDVMVSAYFHFLFDNSHNHSSIVKFTRDKLQFKDYEAVSENLPRFIEYMFTSYSKRNTFHFSWSEAVQNIINYNNKICVIRYEDLLIAPVKCLERAISFYELESPGEDSLNKIVENYSFTKLTKRNPGEEDKKSFVRKGITGDWKNYFNDEACEIFKRYAGMELIEMGYEKNNMWQSHLK